MDETQTSINYFTDESGQEDWSKNDFYTFCSASTTSLSHANIAQSVVRFRTRWADHLSEEINYLHASEITLGINHGEGRFGQLKDDDDLRERFFLELGGVLTSADVSYVCTTLSTQDFLHTLYPNIHNFYSSRGEVYALGEVFNTSIYPLTMLIHTEGIRKHLNMHKTGLYAGATELNLLFEEKHSDFAPIEKRCEGRFSDFELVFNHGVPKASEDYDPLFELADMVANAVRNSYISGRERLDYNIVKTNVEIDALVNKDNLEDYIAFNL